MAITTREHLARLEHIKEEICNEIIRDLSDEDGKLKPQKEIMEITGLYQTEVSYLVRGKLERFSVDRLLMLMFILGHDPKVYIT